MQKFLLLLKQFKQITQDKINTVEDLNDYFNTYVKIENYNTASIDRDSIIDACCELIDDDNILFDVYVYSYMLQLTKSRIYAEKLIKYIDKPTIPFEVKVFVKKQLDSVFFNYPESACNLPLAFQFLRSIVGDIRSKLKPELLSPIPYEERDHDYVVVLTSQVLSLNHGPTKHALDHCASLIKGMGKKVLLINTAEMLGRPDYKVLFSGQMVFNYLDGLTETTSIPFNGINIPFFQCGKDMPNVETIQVLVDHVRMYKPEFILEIGSGSFTAGILDSIVPVLTNGTMHAQIECTATRYQTLARELTKEDLDLLDSCNYKKENIIFSMFTSAIKPKTLEVNRSDLKLPDESFVVACVGNRLGNEITEELFRELCKTVKINPKIYYIFFGSFNTFDDRIRLTEGDIKEHFIYHGTTTDTVSCMEKCDLYLNPPRIGGGMSSIEALATGLPAVSLLSGDGGIVLGTDFSVSSVDDFANQIIKYSTDADYYNKQAVLAKERGIYLQDSDRVFCDTVREFLDMIAN